MPLGPVFANPVTIKLNARNHSKTHIKLVVGQQSIACCVNMGEGKHYSIIDTISESVSLGDVDELRDFQDEGMPMQRLAHSSSLKLQVSLNYLYCLIPCSTLFSRKYLIDTAT